MSRDTLWPPLECDMLSPITNADVICCSLICEFPATGGAVSSWNIRSFKLLRYVTTMDYLVLACECLFVVFILYYIVEEALEVIA